MLVRLPNKTRKVMGLTPTIPCGILSMALGIKYLHFPPQIFFKHKLMFQIQAHASWFQVSNEKDFGLSIVWVYGFDFLVIMSLGTI